LLLFMNHNRVYTPVPLIILQLGSVQNDKDLPHKPSHNALTINQALARRPRVTTVSIQHCVCVCVSDSKPLTHKRNKIKSMIQKLAQVC